MAEIVIALLVILCLGFFLYVARSVSGQTGRSKTPSPSDLPPEHETDPDR